MSLKIVREITSNLQACAFYTIMVDEATDCSNKEQVVIVLRWVDDMHAVGASNMSGAKTGVAKRITDVEKRALYIHCYGHALNLACNDAMKQSKVLKDSLAVAYEITKLIKFSPKREGIFEKLKEELIPGTPGIRVLCSTRWTVRAKSLHSIFRNYTVLEDTFEESKDCASNTEIKSGIIGAIAQMKMFDFPFGIMLGELILNHCDNLSATLQNPTLSASEGQVAQLT